jgi:hypothetical protein
MDQVMTDKLEKLLRPKVNVDVEEWRLQELLDELWRKVFERCKTTNAAFRYFDDRFKGKFKKADFIVATEKLRLRLTAANID